ncbi:MAG: mannonate dehydratase [Tateyamaria sp.]|uniref:mannonate dehydratase n=1 Tax=Tateyamaria sp. TaxID=1929288 RepID=UPI0032A12401
MIETWRWFGPDDSVSLAHVRQAGAAGIVTALHHMPPGEVWTREEIVLRRDMIAAAGLEWSVVESIPVHPAIKLGTQEAPKYIARWIETMQNLAAEGLDVICYNFMPVVDWTRTDLRYPAPNGGLALRFDPVEFAAYDLFILARAGAKADYDPQTIAAAAACFAGMDSDDCIRLETTIIAGLPGSELNHGREDIRAAIAEYDQIDPAALRANLITFLKAVTPAAEACGARICLHPDDPPYSIFGLPRVVSTQADYAALFDAVPAVANGITLCAGSLGSRADNDVLKIAQNFADRIHFAHLRNVTLQDGGAFFEDDHLEGGVDMVALTQILMREEARRRADGRDDATIPMRPDHGHLLIDDITKDTNPGYSAIGRLKGLAELRGIARAITALENP